MRKIKAIIIHHSASPRLNTNVSKIKQWHKAKGWDHIGYHRIIGMDGSVAHTLSFDKEGYHVYGKNADSIGICVVGNFENEEPTRKQIEKLIQELVIICKKFGLTSANIYGHYEYALPDQSTACPGKNLIKEMPAIKAKVNFLMGLEIEKKETQSNKIIINPIIERRMNWFETIILKIRNILKWKKNMIASRVSLPLKK